MMEPKPFETVQQIAGGYILPRCLHVVADPGALGRVLRLLAAYGVFEAQGDLFRDRVRILAPAAMPVAVCR